MLVDVATTQLRNNHVFALWNQGFCVPTPKNESGVYRHMPSRTPGGNRETMVFGIASTPAGTAPCRLFGPWSARSTMRGILGECIATPIALP